MASFSINSQGQQTEGRNMDFVVSNMTAILVSSIIVIGLALQFFMFFKSIKIAFYVFLGIAAIQLLALGMYWLDSYQSYRLLDRFVQPIASQFDAPQSLSEDITLQNIAWDGRHLSHTYVVTSRESVPRFDVVRALSCRGQTRVNILALGAVIEHVYFFDGTEVASYRVALTNCFSNE